jgi:YwiC-like protein
MPDLRAVWRGIAPAETGGWFMVLMPLSAALALRPSRAGLALAAAGLASFLLREPLRAIRARIRVHLARRLLGGGAALAFALLLAVCLAAGIRPLLPPLAALPLAAWALWADLRRQSRDLAVEWAAMGFFCALACGVVLAAGASWQEAIHFGLLAFLCLAPGFAAVRYQLYSRRNPEGAERAGRFRAMHAGMLATLAAGASLFILGWVGPWWILWQGLLYGRAWVPLHRGPAWHLGVLEIFADSSSLLRIESLRFKGRPQGFDDGFDGTVHEVVDLVDGHPDPVVGHPTLGEVVGANLLTAVPAAHLGFAHGRVGRIGLVLGGLEQPAAQEVRGPLQVLDLALGLLAFHEDPGRQVGDPHSRLGRVHALATLPA